MRAAGEHGRGGEDGEHDGILRAARYSRPMLRGAIAAALTPLAGGGAVLDESAFEPYVAFLAAHGIDGLLALGTTGEGVLFDVEERKRVAELFLAAAADAPGRRPLRRADDRGHRRASPSTLRKPARTPSP